ncbi:hypothetical protein Pryu01_00300 [Paraliobacillus ryukyuensis]|uniref:Threonine/homoserine/homoserine lactone efflux protein n=1 Tax=Paraliobacillus ryukyuensis TaxID=200904 RepID=A0A366EH09_9BACI|nr:LysE family transporter [Paraliobacillus ryukyuensis]RBP01628.1 threonine/homoserine/homoserine lactone efflux protein [Paraliobacillus ryukyuensis]
MVLLSYVLLGLSLAAPIGPINAAQMSQGIKNGFMHAWFIGLGSILAECLFIIAVFFGVVHLLESSFVRVFLWSFGSFVLAYTAIESLTNLASLSPSDTRTNKDSLVKTFWSGFILSLTNPLSILFWLGIYGSILANSLHKYDLAQVIYYGAAILAGLMLWDIFMATLSSGFRYFLKPIFLQMITVLSAVCLLGFAGYFGYHAFQLLF